MDADLKLPSRFEIGDMALFQPNLELVNCDEGTTLEIGAVRTKVVGVSFEEGKVLYDLAVAIDGNYFCARPLRGVDSIFVCTAAKRSV